MRKNCKSEDKFCLKNELIYPYENSKITKKEEISFAFLQNMLCQIYLQDHLSLGIKSYHTAWKIVFCCDVLRNGF